MELKLKITCTCHQAKIEKCCQTPLVAPMAQKICKMLNPNLPSYSLSDHSSNTSFNHLSLDKKFILSQETYTRKEVIVAVISQSIDISQ